MIIIKRVVVEVLIAVCLLMVLIIPSSGSCSNEVDINNFGNLSKSDPKVILGVGSRHIDSVEHENLNEDNPSIGVELWDIQAVYVSKNSWDVPSWYLTYTPDYKVNKYLSLAFQGGVATGYTCDLTIRGDGVIYTNTYCSKSGVVPLAALTFDIKPTGDVFALSVSLSPEVIMFSVNYTLPE